MKYRTVETRPIDSLASWLGTASSVIAKRKGLDWFDIGSKRNTRRERTDACYRSTPLRIKLAVEK